ncbi:MAG TPA: ATP-binding cassette domain-containing protein [Clostridiales bacterium]|nr:ATP-binding cassette domain-containing protein [Clostridiales bacterium]
MDIQLHNVSKSFEGKSILKDLNITFPEGRLSCLMGASGIGKTTVVNIIMGLIKPDSGEVAGTKQKKVAAVFQEDRLIEHWDAVRNIGLVCGKAVTEEAIVQELNKVGITDCRNKAVKDFSGGMRRRVALVRAVLAKSDIIIMDEPFKGLDEGLKDQVIEYVRENTKGKTVIVITHDREEVGRLGAGLVQLEGQS